MRHAIGGIKLGRDSEHRLATLRNLAAALIQHGQITTTYPRAKAVRPMVDKLITLARKGDLASRRRAISIVGDRELIYVIKGGQEERIDEKTLIQKLFDELGPRFKERPGGYTRVIKLARHRIGDGSDLVVLQLVGDEERHNHTSKSNRRAKQDNRTAFAAKLRKGAGKSEPAPETAQAPADADKPAE
ncbi:MAG: 50S ribosomal protein L17 [Planctomycetes bacterium]|nr:50S ribosomal protein L17 [Planctomycetota bacterium]